MDSSEKRAFRQLLNEVYVKCHEKEIKYPLSEPECKIMASIIEEKTGLVIGWKSLKNYFNFLLADSSAKTENPNFATLDTLSRYVLDAPATSESDRKIFESHYPWWFKFQRLSVKKGGVPKLRYLILFLVIAIPGILTLLFLSRNDKKSRFPHDFTDNFQSTDMETLTDHGWLLKSPDPDYWKRRNEMPGFLTLYTLRGDSWPDTLQEIGIRNFLIRKTSSDCFTTEIHFKEFVPEHNWQQAGLLIMEDSVYAGKSIRVSIAYNGYFGGFSKPGEIFIQAVSSLGNEYSKPEELAHYVIFSYDSFAIREIRRNLSNSALRIEKIGDQFRFLYAGGEMENSAFREVAKIEFRMKPRYIGIFALKGFVSDTMIKPVYVNHFILRENSCD